MDAREIRKRFLNFFEAHGHTIVPSSSLLPKNDPSVLFTTAGMQQFKPYYSLPENATKDFHSRNVTSVQKCVRTGDIDEVGDATHCTFFEMLGNFSFGGYWKEEAIRYAYDFITKELGLPIDYVSVFKDEKTEIPADEESRKIWKMIDPQLIIKDHTYEDNFWGPTGNEGPCGPTTEIYINGVEVWNIVFNEYYKTLDGKYEPLAVKGIDTGMGFERLLVQKEQKENVYETDVFQRLMAITEKMAKDLKSQRIIADHFRTSVFLIADGVLPSNKDQGYILRRLLRRVLAKVTNKTLNAEEINLLVAAVADTYEDIYPELREKTGGIKQAIEEEISKFEKTLAQGLKEFEKGTDPFVLATTYGFPIELTEELAKERGTIVDRESFEEKMKEHQSLSRTSSAGMFKGGLANTNEQTVKLHTAHHLLLRALQEVLGPEVKQRGSNITEERLRIDFSYPAKLSDEQKKEVETLVNQKIKENLKVEKLMMPKEEAEKLGAEMEFGAKYPDMVSVYVILNPDGTYYSKEFCGGPHVAHTEELGKFKIQKEEAVSQGVRRIKAVLS